MTDYAPHDCPPWPLLATLLDQASVIGMAIADEPDLFRVGGAFQALRDQSDARLAGWWNLDDVVFANQCVRGLVSIVAFQLRGLSQLCRAEQPMHLHPLVTIVRGIAETAGTLWWQIEPWIDSDPERAATPDMVEWLTRSERVVVRGQLRHVVELAIRRRRVEAAHGAGAAEHEVAKLALDTRRADLEARYNGGASLKGHSNRWTLADEAIPEWGELVHRALELAHGQDHDGKIAQRIYPMLSGFAHPSLEMLYAHTSTGGGPLTPQLICSPSEAQLLVSTAGRIAAAAYDIAFATCGLNDPALQDWEATFDAQVVIPGP